MENVVVVREGLETELEGFEEKGFFEHTARYNTPEKKYSKTID